MSDLAEMAPRAFRDIAKNRMPDFLAGIGAWNHPSRIHAAEILAGCRTILDVGCGPAVFLETLTYTRRGGLPFNYAGADPVAEMLEGRDGGSFAVATAESLPYEDQSFDGVLLRHVLEHLPQPRKALQEAARVCKRDLVLVFSQWPNNGARSILTDAHLKAARWSHSRSILSGATPGFELVTNYRFAPGGNLMEIIPLGLGREKRTFHRGMRPLAPREELWHLSRNRAASLAALELAKSKP